MSKRSKVREQTLGVHLKGEMENARCIQIGDAARELRSELPELVVVLDAHAYRDAVGQVACNELDHPEADVL